MNNQIRELIAEADMVLVGIGAEFEHERFQIKKEELAALDRLAELLEGRNYFVVSIGTNDAAKKSKLREDRIVQPCGTTMLKQCVNRCEQGLLEMTEADTVERVRGVCPKCGGSLVLNNVYAEQYDENGYLKDWGRYTKWLQGTLNKKLCILELGVDLTYPSIIRWPFEKVAFYNNKAHFVRVNERLYHMSEEIKDKGISVPKNAVEWLNQFQK